MCQINLWSQLKQLKGWMCTEDQKQYNIRQHNTQLIYYKKEKKWKAKAFQKV